jgi:hypothetical protein
VKNPVARPDLVTAAAIQAAPVAAGGDTSSEFLDLLDSRFASARAASGGIDRSYTIAGRPVRLQFAGKLESLIEPALAHLSTTPSSDVSLTVSIWDSASTGTDAPPLPEVARPGTEELGAIYAAEDGLMRMVYQPGFGALSVLTADARRAFYWLWRADDLPYWEQASPIRQILQWWLASHGVQQVHGGAVGEAQGGVLLVGNPGSGKSTSALASLESELLYAGDDYVAVANEPTPMVYSLYCTAKLEPGHVRRLAHVEPLVANRDRLGTEKAVVNLAGVYAQKLTRGFPLSAILLPTVRGSGKTRLIPVAPSAAMMALAPSTIMQLHTARPDALARMKALVTRVPAFVLELGSDIHQIPVVIEDFLGRART